MSNYYLIKNRKVALHFEEVHYTEISPSSFPIQFTFCCPVKESKDQLLDKAFQVTSTFPFHRMLKSKRGLSQSYRLVARHQYTIRMNIL